MDALPNGVEDFLVDAGERLRSRKVERIRLYPLVLRDSVERLLERRRGLFDHLGQLPREYGHLLTFRRDLKASSEYPTGRICEGAFDILRVSDRLAIVASMLVGDEHKHGPLRLAECAYPLARRPFFPSTTLIRIIESFAEERRWTAVARDTYGYHRQSRSMRRDTERQPPAAAAREMAEQGRQVHRMGVRFQGGVRTTASISFDRHASLDIVEGQPRAVVVGLMLRGVSEAAKLDSAYEVTRSQKPLSQEVVQIRFAEEAVGDYDAMYALCDAVRESAGLNVAVIHLNPYLQAQILDFFTGGSVDMLVTDARSVSLVPRSARVELTIQRIADTILRHFGEGKVTRDHLQTANEGVHRGKTHDERTD